MFYTVVGIGRFNLGELREAGWLFTSGESKDPWYKFYTLFGSFIRVTLRSIPPLNVCVDFKAIQWGPFWGALPTQLALYARFLHPVVLSLTIF